MVRSLQKTKDDIDLPSRVGHLNVCFGGLRTYRLMATLGAKQTTGQNSHFGPRRSRLTLIIQPQARTIPAHFGQAAG